MSKHNYLVRLDLSWSTSRGRDTYGYNIARLYAADTGKTYRACGGGYDMVGSVFANWLKDAHQGALRKLANRAFYIVNPGAPMVRTEAKDALYGAYAFYQNSELEKIVLDGACGIESMIPIAEAIGLEVQRTWDKKGRTTGFIVSDKAV